MRRKKLYLLLCIFLLACIAVAGWNVGRLLLEYHVGEQTYEEMKEISRTEAPKGETSREEASGRDFAALQAVNPDVVAWISVPDTGIDYPVVQGDDNSWYLRRLVTGEWNASGSIFLDCQAAPDFSDRYSIIYGHNMLNGTMFSSLMEYKDQEFYDRHPTGILETPEETYEISFFAGFVAEVTDPAWNTDLTAEELPEWAERVQAQSCFQSGAVPTSANTIIALATCSYEFDNARFILLGLLGNSPDA